MIVEKNQSSDHLTNAMQEALKLIDDQQKEIEELIVVVKTQSDIIQELMN